MKAKDNSVNEIKRDTRAFEKLMAIIGYMQKIDQKDLGLTRLLKYLYKLDEMSVKTIGSPSTNLTYKVAGNGPLADWLWYTITNKPDEFSEYFKVKVDNFLLFTNEKLTIHPVVEPNTKLLSRFEKRVIQEIIETYKGKRTQFIIDELHGEGTLWSDLVKENKIDFRYNPSMITPLVIDFHKLISKDESKSDSYKNHIAIQG